MSSAQCSSRLKTLMLALSGLFVLPLRAAADAPADRCESPYFLVTSDDADRDALPLEETGAQIDIAGVIAHVRVTQVYRNRGKHALEAVYVFPASTRAAVSGMRMRVGERTIEAAIERREEAHAIYEAARQAGRTASLLDEERPNVFQMKVANILPGDRVEVELDYAELVVPTDGVYELVYPAVVGPRYTGEQVRPEEWHRNPHLGEGEVEPYRFRLGVTLTAGIPIRDVASPSHAIAPRFAGPDRASLALGSPGDGDRDFILRYRLRGDEIQTGLLRFEGDGEKFFLLMVQPPERVVRETLPPREYVFIVDVSGSMSGFPLQVSKILLRDLLRGLRPADRFNLLFFSGGSYQLSGASLPASPANVARALRAIEDVEAGGGTELLGALRKAVAMPHAEDMSRSFVAITDGYVAVEAEAFRLVRENLGAANFFAFGIGSSVNRHLIEGLARAGMAEPFVVENEREAPAQARRFRKMIESPVLARIAVGFDGFDAYEVEPPAIPDLLADRPLVVLGKYRGAARGFARVRGVGPGGRFERALRAADSVADGKLRALRTLWARQRIARLSDLQEFQGEPQSAPIAEIGLRYHLMTAYTSFVAVDRFRRNDTGELVSVRQPLPLPRGVSRNALEGEEGLDETIVVTGRAPVRAGNVLSQGAPTVMREDSAEMLVIGERPVATPSGVGVDVRSSALSAYPVGRMRLDIGERLQLADAGASGRFTAPALVRFGLTERLEARVASQLLSIGEDGTAPPDLTLGAKFLAVSSRGGFPSEAAIGLLGDVQLDTDDRTAERRIWRGSLLAEARTACGWIARVNLSGLYLDRVDGGRRRNAPPSTGEPFAPSRFGFGYAAELSFAPRGSPWLLFAGTAGTIADRAALALEAGLSRSLTLHWVLGLSTSAGLTDAADDLTGALFLRWQL